MLLCPGPTQPQAAAQALHPLATSAPDPDPPTRSQISGGELLQLIATMLTLRWGQILLGNPKLDSGESLDAIRAAKHQRRILENGSSVTPPTLDGEWAVLNGTVDLSVL